jgi:hypothetical protein
MLKNKGISLEYETEYSHMRDGLTNPYYYNFGKCENNTNYNYQKVMHTIRTSEIYKS